MCTSLLNRLLNPIDFMCAEIIHYDNITLFQVRNKRLLNIIEKDLSRQCTKSFPIYRTIEAWQTDLQPSLVGHVAS